MAKKETTAKQRNNSGIKNLKPFKKNDPITGEKDPRINRKGRTVPKDVRELNALIDELLAEEITNDKGEKMQKMRVLLNRLILSKTPVGQIHILDRRFGKVPEKVDLSNTDGTLKGTDAETIDRAVSTLADALRAVLPGKGTE